MFLLILDEYPVKAANLVPDKLKFKQLLELCQLICSAGLSDVYKPIRQGKDLQTWVKNNQPFVYLYGSTLYDWCKYNTKLSIDTRINFLDILLSLNKENTYFDSTTAIFRYSKGYKCDIPSNTELPIKECVEHYKKYVEWKKANKVKGYV